MAFKRLTFTMTADTTGLAAATVHVPIPATPLRVVFLDAVLFDDTGATRVPASFSLFDSNVGGDELNRVFFIDGQAIPFAGFGLDANGAPAVLHSVVYPNTQVNVVTEIGAALPTVVEHVMIRSNYLRARVDGLASGDLFNAVVVIETAGDYRF